MLVVVVVVVMAGLSSRIPPSVGNQGLYDALVFGLKTTAGATNPTGAINPIGATNTSGYGHAAAAMLAKQMCDRSLH